MVGVAKVSGSIGECSFDSGSDEPHPGFEFAAVEAVRRFVGCRLAAGPVWSRGLVLGLQLFLSWP